jgi:hypothetical protein
MAALRDAISALARVPAGADREYYVRWLSERHGPDSPDRRRPLETELRQALANEIKRTGRQPRRIPAPASGEGSGRRQGQEKPAPGRAQAALLAAFLQRGDLAERYLSSLEVEDFPAEGHKAVFGILRRLVERKETVSAQAALAESEPEARTALAELALEYVPEDHIEESVASGVRRLAEARLRREESALVRRLNETSSQEDREAVRQQLTKIARERSDLAGRRIVGDG